MTIEQFVEKFERLYEEIRIATLNGDYINGNRAEKEKRKLYNKLSKDEKMTIDVLEILLKSANVVTRISAASYFLKLNVNVKVCLKMLKEISKNKEFGIFCFNAEMTLKVYNGEMPNRTL